ncbi:NAD(P)H-binding protein [Mangrovibacterium diazotrophicum]|uniref:Putative NAD(P)-binding protein n=1 Tax=Mangrovibacterium diazotrophicum TaxID=1261403 RepID=A0A419W720_9BACT|nr:NAD(P)H-binding protein [Mangrovibacterium diazotrophicum]RKD91267.1 putative NAD(P)-binding protein [Mangrovibacterium diazotrophicum]
MKALVIGATGLVGGELVKALLTKDEFSEVVVFGRRETGLKHPKLREEIVNFNQPENWASKVKGDVLFSCLGTTIKKAGSQENQFKIDYTFQYTTAEAAAKNNVAQYILVSSSGAKANSSIFYSRIKGQLEEAILQLPFRKITILRPSLLLGERNEKRGSEAFAQKIMPAITRFIFKKYRPIPGATVARAMIQAALHPSKQIVFELDEIFRLAE